MHALRASRLTRLPLCRGRNHLCQGPGEPLADGIKAAWDSLGRIGTDYAVHVNGKEVRAHDPRFSSDLAQRSPTEQALRDLGLAFLVEDSNHWDVPAV